MPLEAGTKLGPYEVTAPIGAGGMGEVYRARDTKLNRDVALKVLPEAFVSEPERLARFQREAEVLASLNHPNIAHIYGLEDSGDTTAIVLELVEGETLAERIARGAIPLEEALDIAKQISDALEAAHALGIIHRDLKPANIKVTHDGIVKVLDFGLAKALTGGEGVDSELSMSPTLTKGTAMGTILGTAAYMSPEQAKGKPVDARTDVWAFGVVLYEMLAGERAFKGEDVSDTLVSVFRDEPDWTKLSDDVPARIRQAMRVCLLKDAKERVRDISAVRLAMAGAFETEGVLTHEATVSRRRPSWLFAVAAVGLFVAGGLAVWTLTSEPERPVGRFVVSAARSGTISASPTNHELAISPDGSRIVYATGVERQLYVRPVDELEGVSGLGGSDFSDTPFFSPDGAWVGFATFSDTSWKKVSILGGPPITLWDGSAAPRGGTWGPDGTIIFAHNRAGTGLFRGSDAGGEPEVLTTPDASSGELNHFWPAFLPGGDAVLFTIFKGPSDQDREIGVLDLESSERKVIIRGGSGARYASTGHIVYGAEGTLRAAPFDLSRLEVTGDPVPVLEDVMTKASGAVVYDLSSTGSLVYASGQSDAGRRFRLVWVDRSGDVGAVAAEPRNYREFSLSPDGTRVALRIIDIDATDIWLYDFTRRTSTRLTFDPPGELFPTWMPDGARVAFGSSRIPVSWKAADGTGDVEPLGELGNQLPQAFAPDGQTVVFESRADGRFDIGILSLDGERTSTLLLDTEFSERNATLSRDGRWLAYQSDESGRFEIYVRPFPEVNAGRWQISSDGGEWPLWSPSGDELFYRGPSGLMSQSYTSEPTFTPVALTQLFEWDFVGQQNRRMAVSPDGERFLLFEEVTTGTDDESETGARVILVENWFEELKARVPN